MTTDAQFPSIKTEISEFCEEFANILAPFEAVLREAREEVQGKTDSDALQHPIAGISDAHHRLETLISKVEEQQAYVIIFGPLKSGKSTLMNAISATYVSEVTSLPAYPCLVHVKYGDTYKFVASRYNGEKLTYADNKSLQLLIQDSHEMLAARLREAEERGEEFEPGVHYPEALRRIDVEVPAKNLQESLAVLVDTPGLYSRMKFGYDLMTREFRNSAACAVFVVKTDTLFLEQVFEEFGDLLNLFSRIFLVVNVDSNKRDLEPDGSFKPSLESESPGEVIRAFESLVMSAPLRKAAEEGRLKIYPIDLLNAASAALMQAQEPKAKEAEVPEEAAETNEADSSDDSEVEVVAEAVAETQSTREDPTRAFSVFLNDLTQYLNSNDYLHEFMGDSLNLGKRLAGEIQNHCSAESTGKFRERQAGLRRELQEVQARLNAIEKLETLNWNESFSRLRGENRRGAESFSKNLREETEGKAIQALDNWFESDESLSDLQQKWDEIFESCRKEVEKDSADRAASLVAGPYGGVELTAEVRRAIDDLDQVLEPAIEEARSALANAKSDVENCNVEIQADDLKVRKGFWDWILFRSLASVRRRIFGDDDKRDVPVAPQVKQKQLGDDGKQALQEIVTNRLAALFPNEAIRVSEALFENYIKTLGSGVREKLESGKTEYTQKKSALEGRLRDNAKIQEILDRLTKDSVHVVESILTLREKYRATSWDPIEDLLPEEGENSEDETNESSAFLESGETTESDAETEDEENLEESAESDIVRE